MAIERRAPAHNVIAVYRSERYALTVIEIASRHFMVTRHHDAVTVDVTGDDAAHLRHCVDVIEKTPELGVVAYDVIDRQFVHPCFN